MSRVRPNEDPRERTDSGSHSQTEKPWKGVPEKEQKPQDQDKQLDLEKWHETKTH